MDELSKKKLFYITFILDLFLVYIIIFQKLNKFDFFWVLSVIICHILFYYNLIKENRKNLDILHYFVFILPLLSLFAKNILIKILSISLLILIQILWIVENRCILNGNDDSFGFGNKINYLFIIFTPILGFNIGYTSFN
tara:strand:- start:315 stop:731 length:417 start_codon:yes stop_codon:yes gene_type:complete